MEIQTLSRQTSTQVVDRSVDAQARAVKQAEQQAAVQQEKMQKAANIKEITKKIQKAADVFNRKLQFRVNEDIDEVIVTVIDLQTNKVIREIPSKEMQRLQERLQEVLGILFDETI